MNELHSPDCKVYVDTELSDRELLGVIMQVISDADDSAGVEMELYRNDEYDSQRRVRFPDGFLYFRYYIDAYLPEKAMQKQAALIGSVLQTLWAMGIPAVAASQYEHLLPERGGYRSRAIPWTR
jgi:hypothetical protein